MKISQQIAKKVEKMEEGLTFKYADLGVNLEQYEAAIKALVRLEEQGVIKRLSKGVYYKPKQSVFGVIGPREEERLRPYLYDGKKRFAYITGASLYNRMGLTTQVANTIKVASRGRRVSTSIGNLKVMPVKSYLDVTNDNYLYLEFLDALKDFNNISDIDKRMAIKILRTKLSEFADIKKLIKIALEYPARTRAFLGALLKYTQIDESEILKLRNSLNLVSKYSLGLNDDILEGASYWRIK
ncbi:MAG: DUF6088 family protein [Marinifilaceae bacterium]|jgi:hypothetical protein